MNNCTVGDYVDVLWRPGHAYSEAKRFLRGRTSGGETWGSIPRTDRARNRARHQEEAKGNYGVLRSRGRDRQTAEGVGRGGAKGNMAKEVVKDGTRAV